MLTTCLNRRLARESPARLAPDLRRARGPAPPQRYVATKALGPDMPQLPSLTVGGHAVGIPFDASFLVTTVNKKMFTKAGVTKMPTTIDQYTQDLKQIKAKGEVQYPLNIPFAAAEGLSTYWYQTTAAFGGTILDGPGKPQVAT